ncbi:SDR family oxidoreductase [Aquincola tertiaricarbonis]|uniref:SDR family oxidoreductase n=1 Tax=Aquincola tertiaricarbonis TaxID=391953 RepID=A0ABY4S2D5_AQUTE|nr:SDR family oxidoreductase [Aquincola tertiaricarbonis]URI06549.1 SDR family oxidoreductase [Aquincola tertiaricarbonis]
MRPEHARVLLTGATGGIGQAMARALVKAGASVLLAGRSPAALAAQCQALQAPDRVHWHAADMADTTDIASLARTAADWGCNVVVHGAGLPAFGPLESIDPAEMQRLLQVNLLAPMVLTQALLAYLRSQPQAQVICVGSVLGALGLPGYSVYGASKAGLRGFAQALRRELAGGPVKVQYLGPRSTRTGFNSAAAQAHAQATHTATDSPEVVAEALLQLLRSEAAERFLGTAEQVAVRLNGLASTLLDGAFASHRKHLSAQPSLSAHAPRA